MTLKHMTILVDAYCAIYQIDEHMKEIFGNYVINEFGGIAKAFPALYTVIKENCPSYDGSDDQNERLMKILDDPELTSEEKALRILATTQSTNLLSTK